ncbi:hypothetical protein Bxe_A4378 [Paraburkholderia xenovorans LB400]|uniref:Uncharacterized protein n=1 Tax=Paraburkholderia xenovorans (strain LB400) TaxID=266265 RepID=Q146W7_PARXL|nr:hypothetical protein Bxe_A4378 [Paraburkholderia xenovorans LB400]
MLLRYCLPATGLFRLCQPALSAYCPDKIFRRRFRPGAGYALTGQFVLILQWARIVTESQSGTATGENPPAARRYPENITRARPKSDGRARFNTAGFSRVFHTRAFSTGFRPPPAIFSR